MCISKPSSPARAWRPGRRCSAGVQSELIRIVDLAQRGETQPLPIDAKRLAAKGSVAGEAN
jgi:hypothetical protein